MSNFEIVWAITWRIFVGFWCLCFILLVIRSVVKYRRSGRKPKDAPVRKLDAMHYDEMEHIN